MSGFEKNLDKAVENYEKTFDKARSWTKPRLASTGCVYTPEIASDLLIRNRMADKYKEYESNGSLSERAQTALVLKFSPLNSKT